jgi:hypothetical protein
MTTLLIAYSLVWLALIAYVVHIAMVQRRLNRAAPHPDPLPVVRQGVGGAKRATCLILAFLVSVAEAPAADVGVIEGRVVNGTTGLQTAAGVEVLLQIAINGQFVVAERTTTQADGRFRFAGLPVDMPGPYLPGANLQDVHFPGPRVLLTASQPSADVTLTVFDSSSGPCPLIIENHWIVVDVRPGALHVRETMLVQNPSSLCYIGSPKHQGGGPVTLQLGIPIDFRRITFDKEAFGRQFQLINDQLITGIPWPPGTRELAFSYVAPNEQGQRAWRRRVDLPCSHVQLIVRGGTAENITSNLPAVATGRANEVWFESNGLLLPAGHVLELQLDRLPLALAVVAKRGALTILIGLVLALSFASIRRRPWVGRRAHLAESQLR